MTVFVGPSTHALSFYFLKIHRDNPHISILNILNYKFMKIIIRDDSYIHSKFLEGEKVIMSTQGIQKITQKFGGILTKNSPSILTGLGVAGLIATTVMAVKATPKALEILDREYSGRVCDTYDNHDLVDRADISPIDTVKLTWKCYVPAAIMGAVTIGCIIGANKLNLKRNAALLGLYSLSEAALKEYQAKVVETIGKPKEKKVKDEIAKDRIIKNPVSDNEIIVTNKGNTLCYDYLSGRYFMSDIETIRQVLNKLSRDMMSESFVDLNHVYSELGLKETRMGDMIGWHIDDGLIEPSFSSQLTENGTPCLVLDFETEPRYNPSYY